MSDVVFMIQIIGQEEESVPMLSKKKQLSVCLKPAALV
jgi:hypothetical protein